jgi:hypothetical protein
MTPTGPCRAIEADEGQTTSAHSASLISRPKKVVTSFSTYSDPRPRCRDGACRLRARQQADDKCTTSLFDLSTEESSDILLNICRPQAQMPVVGSGDVVIMLKVKVRYGSWSRRRCRQGEAGDYISAARRACASTARKGRGRGVGMQAVVSRRPRQEAEEEMEIFIDTSKNTTLPCRWSDLLDGDK